MYNTLCIPRQAGSLYLFIYLISSQIISISLHLWLLLVEVVTKLRHLRHSLWHIENMQQRAVAEESWKETRAGLSASRNASSVHVDVSVSAAAAVHTIKGSMSPDHEAPPSLKCLNPNPLFVPFTQAAFKQKVFFLGGGRKLDLPSL